MSFGKNLISKFFNKKIFSQFDGNKKAFHRTIFHKFFSTRTSISSNNSLKLKKSLIILKSAVFTVGVN